MRHTWKRALSLALTLAMMATLPVVPAAATPAEAPILAADGGSFTYQGETVVLGPHAFYVDGRLSEEQAAKSNYVFTTFNEAVAHLTDGTEAEPMNLYLAPYVYWIHDPQATEATDMKGANQMEIRCKNLHITGLSEDPQDVVVAANFGHDVGFYNGNYTMFYVQGDGLTLKNMTFGDYCNVDLVYPADPTLNVPAREPNNITQGQIGWYDGDKLFAENVRFISRLNMMPFNNNYRALYVNCHMECTDDALNGSSQAVYLGCDLEFYSSKPWASSSGVTLLDCDMKIIPKSENAQSVTQYLVKFAGPFTVVDSSFTCVNPNVTIGWSDVFNETFKSYYSNVTCNGEPITFSGGARPDAGVDIAGKDALKAFKLADGTYNIYNLLRGRDDWDPLGQKAAVTAAGAADLPTSMDAYVVTGNTTSHFVTMESGGESGVATLGYRLKGPQSTDYNAAANVTWRVAESDKQYVELTPNADGSCQVKGINTTEETALVVVTARDASGLEAAEALYVRPKIQPPPVFAQPPVVTQEGGNARVSYTYTQESLGSKRDNTRITWYVCDDVQGTNPIKIAEGRTTTPLDTVPLTQAMAGKHLMVEVDPRHHLSDYGQRVRAISAAPMVAKDISAFDGKLSVDIHTFPVDTQNKVIPGFWTVDSYKPNDTGDFAATWTVDGLSMWAYGTGVKGGVAGVTGIFNTEHKNALTGGNQKRGARLMYAPLDKLDGDMDLNITLAPGKTAGQGFGSANQYMDFMVKYDPANHTGWGLRIYRKTGSTCGFALVSHTANGGCHLLTESKESGMFLPMITVHVWTKGEELHATVTSTNEDTEKNTGPIELSTNVPGLKAMAQGGVNLNHTGTPGDNAIYLTAIDIQWSDWHVVEPEPEPVEPTVYTITADTKVAVTVDSAKNVNVTVDPAGTVYAVSADTAIATATVSNGKVVIKGVKAGSTAVTLGVVDGIGSAEIAVTVNAKSASSGRPSSRPSDRTPAGDTQQPTGMPFADVKADDWFYDSVQKAFEKGLMKGIGESAFAPNDKTTRAMVATVLYRLAGEKKTDVTGLFNDVTADSWFTDAVAWAAEKGIVKGYNETTFGPNDNVTREQLAVMLYRYAAPEAKSEKDLSAFTDAASVSEWATEAITWAVDKGIMNGKGDGRLDPQGLATRAEICTVLVRFLDLK